MELMRVHEKYSMKNDFDLVCSFEFLMMREKLAILCIPKLICDDNSSSLEMVFIERVRQKIILLSSYDDVLLFFYHNLCGALYF